MRNSLKNIALAAIVGVTTLGSFAAVACPQNATYIGSGGYWVTYNRDGSVASSGWSPGCNTHEN